MVNSCIHNDTHLDEERMAKYKVFASAFLYPDESFFGVFPVLSSAKEEMQREYDTLFRAREIWLYGAEYTLKTEFQRASYLSDIMGFYQAFGLETDKDRPDLLSNELEFMYYIIFKRLHAQKSTHLDDREAKSDICLSAEKEFFHEHLYPAAIQIMEAILEQTSNEFYEEMAHGMMEFLESEKKLLGVNK